MNCCKQTRRMFHTHAGYWQDLIQNCQMHFDPAVRAAMATTDVGASGPLTWTAATATSTYTDGRTSYACITTTNFNVVSDKVPAVDHTRCTP